MEKFELFGQWYLPHDRDNQVKGIISFDPVEGAILRTIGNLSSLESFLLLGKGFDIIWGDTERGDAVTLYKCKHYNQRHTAYGYEEQSYSVSAVFFGCFFDDEQDVFFDSLSVNYSFFEQWVGSSGFSGYLEAQQNFRFNTADLHYRSPEVVTIKIDDLTMRISHHMLSLGQEVLTWDLPRGNSFNVHLKQRTTLEIMPDTPMHFERFQSDVLYPLRNFLSLATGATVVPVSVRGKRKECDYENPQSEIAPNEIYMFYVAKGTSVSEEKRSAIRILFGYHDIANDFQSILQNWFNLHKKIKPVMDLYFGLFYIPSTYVHLEFLTLAQTLETYHRRMYGGEYLSSEEYEPYAELLTKAVNSTDLHADHRKSLVGRIKYGYEFSLRKRIKSILNDILKEHKGIVDALIPDINEFVNRFVNTRNYLTHYTKDSEEGAIIDPSEQYEYAQRLKLIMQLCFLIELKLPAHKIEEFVKNNQAFQLYWT